MSHYIVSYVLTRDARTYDLFFGALRHIAVMQAGPRDPRAAWLVRTRETADGLAARLRALLGPLDTVRVIAVEASGEGDRSEQSASDA